MFKRLLEAFFIKEITKTYTIYRCKHNIDSHIVIGDDYIEFRFLNTNIELYKHYLYPTFWLECIKDLRKKFFYEEIQSDIDSEINPYYFYHYHVIPFVYVYITQEDRRPDLTKEEAQNSLGYTKINVSLFWLEYSFILHSLSMGFVYKYDYSELGIIIRSIHKRGWLNTNLISTDLNSEFSDKY